MKRDPLRDELAALAALRDAPRTPEAEGVLRHALGGRQSFAVAAAADLLIESDTALLPLLPPAFERFMKDPARTDKGCKGKTAIAAALHRLEHDQPEVFLRGLHHVQMEPVWGGSQDTAVELRGTCALGLARLPHPEVMSELAELLADPERGARAAAARAIGCTGLREGGPLLRFKALSGDEDPQVLTECLTGLLWLEPRTAVPLVRRFLHGPDDENSQAAALALGQSRHAEALTLLRELAEAAPGRRKVALLALAMLRQGEATDYLLSLVQDGPLGSAIAAVEALGVHRHDPTLRKRVAAAAGERGEAKLREALARAFPQEA